MKNKVKTNKIKIFTKSIFFILTLSLLVLSIAYIPNSDNLAGGVSLKAGTWNSDLVEINQNTAPTKRKYIDIHTLVNVDPETKAVTSVKNPQDPDSLVDTNTIILINDGLGLYYFSELCNPLLASAAVPKKEEATPAAEAGQPIPGSNIYYKQYLTFTYVLGADIDYEEASSKYLMLRPIGWEPGFPFSGHFDGRGYTIKNLFFRAFEGKDEYDFYNGLTYISWFSVNTGTIKNVGLINPTMMQYDMYQPAIFTSPFVGENNGRISNCFVQDLRGSNSGLLTEGGYYASMFVSLNKSSGIIENSYVACDKIVASSVTMSDATKVYPFIGFNNEEENKPSIEGTIKNCYYDGQTLKSNRVEYNVLPNRTINDPIELKEITTSQFNDPKVFKTDVEVTDNSTGTPVTKIKRVWHTNTTYGKTYGKEFRLIYPVLKGLTVEDDGGIEYLLIDDTVDFVYMSELIDSSPVFRKAKYKLNASVDLNSVKENSFVFTKSIFTGTIQGGPKANDGYDTSLNDGNKSKYNTIYNLKITSGISYNNQRCYGLFGILGGTIRDINIVDATISQDDLSSPNYKETNLVGTVCGLLEGGTIYNVHVDSTIKLQAKEANTYLGVEYAGGICGLATKGTIENCTTAGSLTAPKYDNPLNIPGATPNFNHSIGGVVGRVENSDGVINCLNSMTLTAPTYATNQNAHKQFLGGVIGSGKLKNVYQLQNNANIEINKLNDANVYYSLMYIGGVIGRVEEATLNNGNYLNNADITFIVNDKNPKAYISGVMNVISKVAEKYDTFILTSALPKNSSNGLVVQDEIDALPVYEFYSLSNSGTLNITNNLTSIRYPAKYITSYFEDYYTKDDRNRNVFHKGSNSPVTQDISIDIRTAGIVYSYLTNFKVKGAYNLDYKFVRNGKEINKVAYDKINECQTIDISLIDEYAPTFNADNKVVYENRSVEINKISYDKKQLHLDTNPIASKSTVFTSGTEIKSSIILERVYNDRNINYISTNDVQAYMLQLSGCINGRNFNLRNIRNNGDIKVQFNNDTHKNMIMNQSPFFEYFGDYKKLKLFGVMEEVSLNHNAQDIYNGGNIIVSSTVTPNFNLYISGICYKNVGLDPSSVKDPTVLTDDNKIILPKGYIGSLHNCVNNGNIRVTNGDILGETIPTVGGDFYGQSRIGGIACINSATISSTFNLGNIYNINNSYSVEKLDTPVYGSYGASADFEIESGGFCFIMQNEKYDANKYKNEKIFTRSNIIDSANNGNIVSMNTGTNSTWTNAGGFICRNDRSEDGEEVKFKTSTSVAPHLQRIEFSINYGNIYAYNPANDVASEDKYGNRGEQQSKAAGFVCLGASSVVDVINYGKIHSNSVSAGIFGYFMMDRMTIARQNAIDDKAIKNDSKMNVANAINYGIVENIDKDIKNNVDQNISKLQNVDDKTKVTTSTVSNHDKVRASVVGLITDVADDNALYFLNIKNLVNFVDTLDIIGQVNSKGATSVAAKYITTRYMATTNPNDNSPEPFNKGNGQATVDGKTDTYYYGVKSYSKDTATPKPNSDMTQYYTQEVNGGIFNELYVLRKAPTPTLDVNGNIETNNTDNFIADYIQFIPYSKVNKVLIDKIGLEETVLANALANAKNSYYTIQGLLKHNHKNELSDIYNTLITSYYSKLNNVKDELIIEIEKTIDEKYYTTDEIKSILQTLIQNTTDFNEACKLDEVKNIIITLVNKLTPTEAETLLNNILNNNDKIVDLITSYPHELKAYIQILVDTNTIPNPNVDLLRTLYLALTNDNKSLNAYINSLDATAKSNLSSELYTLLSQNNNVKAALTRLYPEIVVATQSDLTNLLNIICPSKPANSGVTEQEYKDIYNSLNANKKTDKNVTDKIAKLTEQDITRILKEFTKASVDPNSDLYKFVDSGRQNATGIILPATKANYLNIINKSNFRIATQENISADLSNNSFTYAGTQFSVDGTTTNSKTNINIIPGERQEEYNYWWLTYYYAYLLNGNQFNYTEWDANDPGPSGFLKITNDIETGVYGQLKSTNNRDDYINVVIYTYIDYGTAAKPKNNLDLTKYMMIAWNELDKLNQTNELTLFRDYLTKLYKASSQEFRFAFKDILFINDFSNGKTVQQMSDYIKNNLTIETANTSLKLITSEPIQNKIATALAKDYSTILDTLLQELDTSNNEADNNKLLTLLPEIFSNGASSYENKLNLVPTIKEIINLTVTTPEEKLQFVANFPGLFGPDIINHHLDSNNPNMALTFNQLKTIIMAMLKTDIQLLKQYHLTLKDKLDDETKATIAAFLIKGDEALFKQYIYNGTSLDELLNLLKAAGLDSSDITDYTGIYAMASSFGIEDGLFLPDNINLKRMDPVYTNEDGVEYRDTSWRGGTTGSEDNTDDINSVNYKVYVQMKQLNKSIATKVFEIQLTNTPNDTTSNDLIVKNNIETDYTYDGKTRRGDINFYIPKNHEIIQTGLNGELPILYIDETKGHYELSHGATFDDIDEDFNNEDIRFKLELPGTYLVGQKFTGKLIVQAEDTKVKGHYNINVIITEPSGLDPFESAIVDGTTSSNNTTQSSNVDGVNVTNVKVGTAVKGYNGIIKFTFGTLNMANGLDLLPLLKVYNTNLTKLSDITNDMLLNPSSNISTWTSLVLDETHHDYIITDTIGNGKVNIPGVDGTGLKPNNSYENGEVFFELKLDNSQSKGIYVAEISYSSKLKYYVFFEKAASDQKDLISLEYLGQKFLGGTGITNNQNEPSLQEFGRPLTKAQLTSVLPDRPEYLDSLVISSLATFSIGNILAPTEVTDPVTKVQVKQYIIPIIVTAEDKTTKQFDHYIREVGYVKDITRVYEDGVVTEFNKIPATANPLDIIYTNNFEKKETPSYRFEYDLASVYSPFTIDPQTNYSVKFYDAANTEVSVPTGVDLTYTPGKDFEINFNESAESKPYKFRLVYDNNADFDGDGVNDLNWHIDFNMIEITKNKNKDSYIDNIVFASENVISSTRTIMLPKEITLEIYQQKLKDTTREIVCLPGQIHYNKYEIVYEPDQNNVPNEVTKSSYFNVIGLVDKTQLDNYAPEFTTPEGGMIYKTTTINGVVYKYVPYYVDDVTVETLFFISEDGTKVLDATKNEITTSVTNIVKGKTHIDQFTYNGTSYKISPVAGYSNVTVTNPKDNQEVKLTNTTLYDDYTVNGGYDEGLKKFNYVEYRCYAEHYIDAEALQKQCYVTIFNIATQDITNNIKFKVNIKRASDCNVHELSYTVYTELLCYVLPQGGTESTPEKDYVFNNRAGFFSAFNENKSVLELTHDQGKLQTNVSGYYKINMFLPAGITFSYTVTDGKDVKSYTADQKFFIKNGIVAKTIVIDITIKNGDVPQNNWGAQHQDDSIIIKNGK